MVGALSIIALRKKSMTAVHGHLPSTNCFIDQQTTGVKLFVIVRLKQVFALEHVRLRQFSLNNFWAKHDSVGIREKHDYVIIYSLMSYKVSSSRYHEF